MFAGKSGPARMLTPCGDHERNADWRSARASVLERLPRGPWSAL
jgi:hypothetical protein